MLARTLGERLARHISQPAIVRNRACANGPVADSYVLGQHGDGYTVQFLGLSNLSWTPLMYAANKYQPSRDFYGVALVAFTPFMTVTGANSPYKDLATLVTAAASKPGAITFASYGISDSKNLTSDPIS